MQSNKKIMLIGAGEFGNFATKVIDMLPDFTLSAVVDTKEEAALMLANKYGAKIYQDYKLALEESDADLIFINTPNFLHEEIVIAALKEDKKVLCEKPLAITEEGVRKVEQVLRDSRGSLMVNFLLPNSSIYKKLQEIIQSSEYGQLHTVEIKNLATEFTIPDGWYWDKKLSGGWFLTADVHFYHLLFCLLNEEPQKIGAKETFIQNKTCAIETTLAFEKIKAHIFHRFDTPYEAVSFHTIYIFDNAEIIIKGWVPVSMEIKTKEGAKKILEKEDRETIYQKLVAQNVAKLSDLSKDESLQLLKEVKVSISIALEAEDISEKEQEKEKYGQIKD